MENAVDALALHIDGMVAEGRRCLRPPEWAGRCRIGLRQTI